MKIKIDYNKFFLLSIISLLLLLGFMPQPCLGTETASAITVFTLNPQNESLKNVLDKISETTGYQIEVTKGWENKKITMNVKDLSLDESLRSVIRALGSPSNIIERNDKTKKIKLTILEIKPGSSSSEANGLTVAELKELHKQQKTMIELASQNKDEIIIPASGDQPAVTRSQLKNLHAQQKLEIKKTMSDPDEIVIPAEGDQPAVTRSQLKDLQEQQKLEIKKMMHDPDEIVIPAEGDQPAVTRSQLKNLQEQQKLEIKKMMHDPDEIVIPAEGNQPGMTKRELEALHAQQKEKIEKEAKNPNAPAMLLEAEDSPGKNNH